MLRGLVGVDVSSLVGRYVVDNDGSEEMFYINEHWLIVVCKDDRIGYLLLYREYKVVFGYVL